MPFFNPDKPTMAFSKLNCLHSWFNLVRLSIDKPPLFILKSQMSPRLRNIFVDDKLNNQNECKNFCLETFINPVCCSSPFMSICKNIWTCLIDHCIHFSLCYTRHKFTFSSMFANKIKLNMRLKFHAFDSKLRHRIITLCVNVTILDYFLSTAT